MNTLNTPAKIVNGERPPDPAPDARPDAALPFGKFRGRPLAEMDTRYLRWALDVVRLSFRLRAGVLDELRRRGEAVPDTPPWQPPPCRSCPVDTRAEYRWQTDRDGGRRIRVACRSCGRFVAWAPQRQPYIALADAAAGRAAR